MMDKRQQDLEKWLDNCQIHRDLIQPLHGDASFRRYFRIQSGHESFIVMDAPPEQESCDNFIHIAEALRSNGLFTPKILARDLLKGFLLLEDFGDDVLLNVLNSDSASNYYAIALDNLIYFQSIGKKNSLTLPRFDRALLEHELNLFSDWFLQKHLNLPNLSSFQDRWLELCELLIYEAQQQPQVWVHRDYHSRNLIALGNDKLGILDFQDAVIGPVSYDVVSLLRDCYIDWPREQVENWALDYHEKAVKNKILKTNDAGQFLRWFDWMGVHRHMKAIGIFARLHLRDNKSRYLLDIPRALNYISEISQRYTELHPLHRFLTEHILPHEEIIQ